MAVPPEAQAHTADGAKAFATFFLSAASQAYVTGSGKTVVSLALSSCGGCAAIAEAAKEQHARETHPARSRYVFHSANIQPRATRDDLVIDLLGVDSSVPVVNSAGATVGVTKSVPSWTRARVRWTPQGWKMANFAVVVR